MCLDGPHAVRRSPWYLSPMPFKPASTISFSPPPRCPECDAGILPYGKNEPLVVDEKDRVYCRNDGSKIEPSYPAVLEAYRNERQKRRLAAIRALEEMVPQEEPGAAE